MMGNTTQPVPTVADIKEIGAYLVDLATKGRLNVSMEEAQTILSNLASAKAMFDAIPEAGEIVLPAEEVEVVVEEVAEDE